MFRLRHLPIDTLREHVIMIHEQTVHSGDLGFNPLDRVLIRGVDSKSGKSREIVGVLNFCRGALLETDEIGLSDEAFRDLGLAESAPVSASLAVAPHSVDLVRGKLGGRRLERAEFNAILADVATRRYSRVELAMFVFACSLKRLDLAELVDYTLAMIETGEQLSFGAGPVVDKHCIGGIPGNRTTMIVVPILAALGLTMPKTSSRAITSSAGTADTMSVLADVSLSADRIMEVVKKTGACIVWGGALELAPADDVLITVERPMELDTEAQMVASILAKKKSVGATHALIDIPVGSSAKVRTYAAAEELGVLFRAVATRIGLRVEVCMTEARGPVGRGIGPRLEALDVLAVLRGDGEAPRDLREKSLYLASRILEMSGAVASGAGYREARRMLDSGAALNKFNEIVTAQGARELPPQARLRQTVTSNADGRIREIDCWEITRVAKRAGAPANPAAGVRMLRTTGDVVAAGDPLFEIHASSESQLEEARSYAEAHREMIRFGF
ncbi:MAG TPA: thymidine phosphorylase family protein [Candidatus Binataceae bacterium]|nr:thymidine phosphorylase family protein [Candidatus Binataceae bacterium]